MGLQLAIAVYVLKPLVSLLQQMLMPWQVRPEAG
jgi:hypothetical protein